MQSLCNIRMKNIKLNLGCGENSYENYVNLDKLSIPGVNIVYDLEKTPLPFEDNSVSEVKCEHILEHIVNFMPLIEDLHRICIPKASINILAPYYKYEGAYRDPTHVRFFTEHSFDYFQDRVKFSNYSKARFKVLNVEKRVRFISDVIDKRKKTMILTPNWIRPFLDKFLFDVYSELSFNLEVIK